MSHRDDVASALGRLELIQRALKDAKKDMSNPPLYLIDLRSAQEELAELLTSADRVAREAMEEAAARKDERKGLGRPASAPLGEEIAREASKLEGVTSVTFTKGVRSTP